MYILLDYTFVFLEKTRRQHVSSDRAENMFVP